MWKFPVLFKGEAESIVRENTVMGTTLMCKMKEEHFFFPMYKRRKVIVKEKSTVV